MSKCNIFAYYLFEKFMNNTFAMFNTTPSMATKGVLFWLIFQLYSYGEVLMIFSLFDRLVAETGFEPVTFGL